MTDKILKKKIMVVNLSSEAITPKPGQTFQPFTVYRITGNDGQIYETTNARFFRERKIGETLELSFRVISNVGKNGKVYSRNEIVIPKAGGNSDVLLDALRKIYVRIGEVEKNILAALELGGKINTPGPEDDNSVPESEVENIEIGNQEFDLASQDEKEQEVNIDDTPF